MIMVTNNDAVQLLVNTKICNTRQEKPRHLRYLNEFRTQQCLLFLEQQCQFHRPYTCFHWHFPNQKRRRPFKRPDGTFNYNPDVYCDKYDETSGSCADGDECPYAHRNAGDTERRYHPRYFKTGNCIYETTDAGACVKNGLHCAFAHGPDDIRLPVYDIREVQDASSKFTVNLPASLEKERVLSEDPKWNEMFHVLACYKTESCKKPPRMCRQGYSCPFYHNGKDKRRAPDRWRYRSTPCPVVRPGDEWQDSGLCEAGDSCGYCHTRTEQQFHPEIYKSTKCNDVINSGYCPRGPFCAFAHCDSELTAGRDFLSRLQQDPPHPPAPSSAAHSFFLPGTADNALSRAGSNLLASTMFSMTSTPLLPSAPQSASFLHRSANPVVTYLAAEPKLGCLPDACKRTPQVATTPVIPNLMSSPITNVGSPPSAMLCMAGGRGRRVARCASPHQNIGVWQQQQPVGSNQVSVNERQGSSTGFATGPQVTFMSTVPEHPTQLAFYHQYRNQDVRNGGRHRSGSSISSEGGITAALHDLAPNLASTGTSTYPGRSSSGPGVDVIRFGTQLMVHPSSKVPQQQLFRSTPKKQPLMPQQQSMAATVTGPPFSLSPHQPHALAYTNPSSDSENLGFGRPSSITSLVRGDVWTHSPSSVTTTPDSWTWRMNTDSGNNSETSITDAPSLLDFVAAAATSPSGGTSAASTIEHCSRDSGLVLDFSMPSNPAAEQHVEHGAGHELPPHYRPIVHGAQAHPHSSFGGHIMKNFTSDFGRGALEDMQTFCNRLLPNNSNSSFETMGSVDPGFHSPLDDILLQSQPGFDGLDSAASFVSPASGSPLVGSNPVAIPRFSCNQSVDSYTSPDHEATSGSSQLQARTNPNPFSTQDTWPTTFDPESHALLTHISSPVTSQGFSPIVGTPVIRGQHKPISAADPLNATHTGQAPYPPATTAIGLTDSKPETCVTSLPLDDSGSSSDRPKQKAPRSTSNLNFSNVPQSPILMTSPFSNPGSDLERLSLKRELDEIRQRLDSKEDEVEALRKQRDFVAVHLRDSLGVIYQLFSTLNVSSKDLSKPLFVDTDAGASAVATTTSGPSTEPTGFGFPGSDSSPALEEFEVGSDLPLPTSGTTRAQSPGAATTEGLDSFTMEKTPLQRQQEALAALFSNPLVAALLNSGSLSAADFDGSGSATAQSEVEARSECTTYPASPRVPVGSVLYKLDQSANSPNPFAPTRTTTTTVSDTPQSLDSTGRSFE